LKLTTKQKDALIVAGGKAEHVMFFGGSRSGKTFLHVRNIVTRAIKAPKSRHAILRYRFNHIKASIVFDTFPKVMEICYPKIRYNLNKTDFFVTFDNGSEIWFGGLDDKERTEKILGNEYVTIYLNECSQISNSARETVTTRLAQQVNQTINGESIEMKTRMYYDCNPPSKAHWSYRLFMEKVDPETKKPVLNQDDYASIQMNPKDNLDNLSKSYLKTLESMSPRLRKRFYHGEFADSNPNALFQDALIDQFRVIDGQVPEMIRIVVAVDPSGSGDEDNAHNDEIGIVVAGLGQDGNAYIMEDCTIKAGPKIWGNVSTTAYDRHLADVLVAEKNFGGEMVRFTIQTAKPDINFKFVTASRGKHIRAEPISALYEIGKVRHIGYFNELENELVGMSTIGYTGEGSPNRVDAMVWAITELFPGVVNKPKELELEILPQTEWSM
jgi:phage terminase large subunit-like protein